jgi:hypothetical protein
MIEGRDLGFGLETSQSPAILGQRFAQEVERDKPVQPEVLGLVYHILCPNSLRMPGLTWPSRLKPAG